MEKSTNKAELRLEVSTQPGLQELESLVATLKQVLDDAPSLGLQVCDLLFSSGYESLKPGFIEFTCVPASRAGGAQVVELHVTDRFRELVATAVANKVERLAID